MPEPLLSPDRVAAALGRPLDGAERAAVVALEEGAPLPAPAGAEAAARAPTKGSGPALPPERGAPEELEAALLALLAAPAGTGAEARADVAEVEPGVSLALARGGARARIAPHRGGALAVVDAAAWLACRGAAPEAAAAAVDGPAGAEAWLALQGAGQASAALGVPLSVPPAAPLPAGDAGAGEPGSLAVALLGRSGRSGRAGGAIAAGFVEDGEAIALVGAVGGGAPASTMASSAYARTVLGAPGPEAGEVAAPELPRIRAVLEVVRRAARAALLTSARPIGSGGLAVALAEACAATGAAVRVPFAWPKARVLFDEEPGRVLVSLPVESLPALEALAREQGAPLVRLGVVGGERLEVQAALSVEVEALREARRAGEAGPQGSAPAEATRA